jgi:cytochrome c oxidase cbb3-type subunit 4
MSEFDKFKHFCEQVFGVDIYAMSSLMIFFIFFVVMLIWVIRADKKRMKDFSQIPLDNNQETN